MLMEEEIIGFLRVGLLVVMVPVVVLVIRLMIKFRKHGYGWFLSHLLLFTIGALTWIRILETRAFSSSVFNSLTIAVIGVMWIISMVCFVKGLLSLSYLKKRDV
ncbi:hypothetical protein GCM10008018_54160 [Paenibacillus marchantiophytorum]|uniref:DUF2651 domain-containing protein n=1 Tax=Paenibacillus marchantiophytorum TaxID=1619310 RepID=A0ABQ1F5Y7_9BACL|nr:hypothetical protein [Paenibacillus marchantiophytorum]GGA01022.1 hypothetical protein GCM10008018_54160 [Paenibacillus marchantiophytorum]